MIYLDSAATCFHRPPEVLQAVTEAMNSFGNPSRGGCGPALQASRMVFQAREALLCKCYGKSEYGCQRPFKAGRSGGHYRDGA